MNKTLIPTPAYIVYEERLRKNIDTITEISHKAGIEIIMALKANALWRTFPLIKDKVQGATASSVNELLLAREFLTDNVHAFAPVYSTEDFKIFCDNCTHITFNSLGQYETHSTAIKSRHLKKQHLPSFGLRVNPSCSVIETDIYNPCLPGSRFGMSADMLPKTLPADIDGFHFHALCESSSSDLEKVLAAFETQFQPWLSQIKWVNMGGGHLMTRKDYDRSLLVNLLRNFKQKYPHLHIILEPGSAFTWQTGDLEVSVLDIVHNANIKTAIIDASFACHMPDCLEMPYKPNIAQALPDNCNEKNIFEYRLGGNSCLSGDYVGTWKFSQPLKPGDRLTLLDMNHYTNVKTTMFNGLSHPSVYLVSLQGDIELLRKYSYEDYKSRMC